MGCDRVVNMSQSSCGVGYLNAAKPASQHRPRSELVTSTKMFSLVVFLGSNAMFMSGRVTK